MVQGGDHFALKIHVYPDWAGLVKIVKTCKSEKKLYLVLPTSTASHMVVDKTENSEVGTGDFPVLEVPSLGPNGSWRE